MSPLTLAIISHDNDCRLSLTLSDDAAISFKKRTMESKIQGTLLNNVEACNGLHGKIILKKKKNRIRVTHVENKLMVTRG